MTCMVGRVTYLSGLSGLFGPWKRIASQKQQHIEIGNGWSKDSSAHCLGAVAAHLNMLLHMYPSH